MTTNKDTDTSDADALGSAAGTSSGVGASTGTQETTSKAYEGSTKQASDIATEEALAILQSIVAVNAKRTYDEAQTTDLAARLGIQTHKFNVDNIAMQALQNAVETANMVSKQAIRHDAIAADRQWNVDEQGYTVAEILRSETYKDAIAGAVAVAVANAFAVQKSK